VSRKPSSEALRRVEQAVGAAAADRVSCVAQRQRKRRERLACGRAVYSIDADMVATEEVLIAEGYLKDFERDDRAKVAAALGRWWEDFCVTRDAAA
jgi:hypothetical protein